MRLRCPQPAWRRCSSGRAADSSLGLHITKQGALQFIASFFGSQDVRTGDAQFDDAFVVKARDEPGVRALFAANAPARQAMVALARDSSDFTFDDDRLVIRWPRIGAARTLHGVMQHVNALAPALSSSPAALGAYR